MSIYLLYCRGLHRQGVGGALHAEEISNAETTVLRGCRHGEKVFRIRPKLRQVDQTVKRSKTVFDQKQFSIKTEIPNDLDF